MAWTSGWAVSLPRVSCTALVDPVPQLPYYWFCLCAQKGREPGQLATKVVVDVRLGGSGRAGRQTRELKTSVAVPLLLHTLHPPMHAFDATC